MLMHIHHGNLVVCNKIICSMLYYRSFSGVSVFIEFCGSFEYIEVSL